MKSEIKNSALGLTIVLDSDEIFPNDPGQGTPVMVILDQGKPTEDSGTFNCAVESWELSHKGTRLSERQVEWLSTQEHWIGEFLCDNPVPASEKADRKAFEEDDLNACTSCGSKRNVDTRYSFGVYAGRLCLKCCKKYRDHCGTGGASQGDPRDLDEPYWED